MTSIDHQHIELLSYSCWQERGQPIGSPEIDWFRALELLQVASVTDGLPLASLQAGPVTASAPHRRRPTARHY